MLTCNHVIGLLIVTCTLDFHFCELNDTLQQFFPSFIRLFKLHFPVCNFTIMKSCKCYTHIIDTVQSEYIIPVSLQVTLSIYLIKLAGLLNI